MFVEDNNSNTKVDDIIETSNHFKLVDYMLDIANEILSEDMIKKFHTMLKTGTSDERKSWFNVGEYKSLANEVAGMDTSSPENVKNDIEKLLDWYNSLENITFEYIIKFHADFEKIHPFQDGNRKSWSYDYI